jgi:hypothetical protein
VKIDLDTKLIDPMGKPFSDNSTALIAAYGSVTASLPEDQQMTPEQKLKLYRLTQKIALGGIVDLSSEEISTIKARAVKVLPVIAFGVLCDILEHPLSSVEHMPAPEQKVG